MKCYPLLCSLLLGVLVLTLSSRAGAANAPDTPPVKMLFLHCFSTMDPQYCAELQQAGIAVTQRGLKEPISLEEFKSYNVVVIADFIPLDAAFEVGATDVANWWDITLPNLRSYVQQGGGLLFTTFFDQGGEALATSCNRMLAPWGASLRAVQVMTRHTSPISTAS